MTSRFQWQILEWICTAFVEQVHACYRSQPGKQIEEEAANPFGPMKTWLLLGGLSNHDDSEILKVIFAGIAPHRKKKSYYMILYVSLNIYIKWVFLIKMVGGVFFFFFFLL